jgi:hypothetical protein
MAYSPDVLERARAETRSFLQGLSTFSTLSHDEQVKLYKQVLDANAARLTNGNGSSGKKYALAKAEPKKASDLIDDNRHKNPNIQQAGQIAGDYIESVNFPSFVKDLVKGVFDANLSVTIQQMEAYQKLLKAATESVSKFVNAIDDTQAFGYLAENQGDDFSISFDDEEKKPDGSPAMVLTDKDGNVVAREGQQDLGDNQIKAKIMDAKIAMAREQRALLRETILMGVTRLVVERGTIKAGVVFDFKATEKIDRNDKAALKKDKATSVTSTVTGPFGNFFGGVSGGTTHTNRSSQISVATTKSTSSTDLSAKLTGSVEIIFKSDYFKLDNFATMYGGIGGPPAAPGAQPAASPQAPAAAPALPPR